MAAAPPAVTGGAVEAPAGALTLLDVLHWHAARAGERVHVQLLHEDAEQATLSYGQLLDRARRIAAGLRRGGLAPGQAVALMLPTSLEFFTSFFGTLLAGGVPVPMYPPTRPSQLEDHLRRQAGILDSCQAPVLVTVTEAQAVARLLATQTAGLKRVCTPQQLAEDAGELVPAQPAPTDLALLQYTSGSTGNPKGVMLSHANLLANIRAWSRAVAITADDVAVSWLPLYHDMGLIASWLSSLYNGIPLVLMSPLDFLARPARWLTVIDRYRGTLSAAPNFAYELVLRHATPADLAGAGPVLLAAGRQRRRAGKPGHGGALLRAIRRAGPAPRSHGAGLRPRGERGRPHGARAGARRAHRPRGARALPARAARLARGRRGPRCAALRRQRTTPARPRAARGRCPGGRAAATPGRPHRVPRPLGHHGLFPQPRGDRQAAARRLAGHR